MTDTLDETSLSKRIAEALARDERFDAVMAEQLGLTPEELDAAVRKQHRELLVNFHEFVRENARLRAILTTLGRTAPEEGGGIGAAIDTYDSVAGSVVVVCCTTTDERWLLGNLQDALSDLVAGRFAGSEPEKFRERAEGLRREAEAERPRYTGPAWEVTGEGEVLMLGSLDPETERGKITLTVSAPLDVMRASPLGMIGRLTVRVEAPGE